MGETVFRLSASIGYRKTGTLQKVTIQHADRRQGLTIELFVPESAATDYTAKRIQLLDDINLLPSRIKTDLDHASGRVMVSGMLSLVQSVFSDSYSVCK